MQNEYVGKINYLDAIIAGTVFFGVAIRTFHNIPMLICLIMAIPVGMAYYILAKMRFVGVILPFLTSFVWAFMIISLLPVSSWGKGSSIFAIILGILLYLLFFKLHVRSIKDFIKDIPGMFTGKSAGIGGREKRLTREEQASVIDGYGKGKEIFREYKAFIENNQNIVFSEFQDAKAAIQNGEQIIMATDPLVQSLKHYNPAKAEKIMEQTQMLYVINENLRNVCYHVNERIRGQQARNERRQTEQERSTNKGKGIDESLFSGCTDKDSLTRRYRQLMKTFHPDNQNGDTGMTQKIQRTYDYLISKQ